MEKLVLIKLSCKEGRPQRVASKVQANVPLHQSTKCMA